MGTILLGGLLLRLWQYLHNKSLWLDEAMLAHNIIERSPIELLTPLADDQAAPALFLLLVDATTALFGTGELALRLVPLLSSLLGLGLFLRVAQLSLERRCVPVAVFLCAFSGVLVYYAQELKQYSLDAAVAIALTYLALRVLRADTPRRIDLIYLGSFGTLAVFLSHPAIFVLAGIASTLVVFKLRRQVNIPLLHLGLVVVLWCVSFGANYLLFLQSFSGNEELLTYWNAGFLPLPISADAVKAWHLAGGRFLSFSGFPTPWHVFVVALCGVAVAVGLRTRSAPTLMMAMSLCFVLCASVVGKYPFLERLTLFAVPFVILLAVEGLQIVSSGRAALVYWVLALCLLAPTLTSLEANILHPIRREEVRPLLARLDAARRPSDRVYVYYGARRAVEYYRRDDTSDSDVWHYGRASRDDRSIYVDDINAMKKWPRVWFLFAHFHEDEEHFFLSRIDGVLLEKHEEHGARLYLYQFEQRPRTLVSR